MSLHKFLSELSAGRMSFVAARKNGHQGEIRTVLARGYVDEHQGFYHLTEQGRKFLAIQSRALADRDLKFCPDCRQVKLAEEFWAWSCRDGRYPYCKPCATERKRCKKLKTGLVLPSLPAGLVPATPL